MAAVIKLDPSCGNHFRRASESSIGYVLEIGVGDLLIHGIRKGEWLVASFLSASQLLIGQVVLGSNV
ncbi:hypothetical protein [Corynebacterium vitaeruminis]|uniref:Uncharacterized protein n=1 Tax=Corynebacterium vitaeruminis DSM 20294 TaxID=1224164 RepID=W5Y449_9CORY|nr:hypothetical protein [Corynebacterium vitaeruminis]AHI23684.1 hypothetical protein B843_11530 [Corynebacterium vitaeruminis DSM 20294]